jgi:hypothetical protein
MRPDMAKVIVERPRIGSSMHGESKGYHRCFQRVAPDEMPFREGMKRRYRGNTKSLNEHLGPLRRYLDSQVGRPWNKVFAEICEHIDRSNAVQDHVRDHVADYVAIHVIEVERVPCFGEGRMYGRPLSEWGWTPWYVCPRTGILKRVKTRRRPRIRPPQPKAAPNFVRVSDSLQCRLLQGAWHVVSLAPLPLGETGRVARDVILDRPVSELGPEEARKLYGAPVFATGKRRLTRRELVQFPIPFEQWR